MKFKPVSFLHDSRPSLMRLIVGAAALAATVSYAQAEATVTVLHTFTGGRHGAFPLAGPISDSKGALYGTTSGGDVPTDKGTVWKLTPPVPPATTWTGTVLYRFIGGSDGAIPVAPLVLDPSSGILYGTTEFGGGTGCGGSGCGTVFQITTEGESYRVIHKFKGGSDGSNPVAGLIIDKTGALYSDTPSGGGTACSGFGCGMVFMLTPPVPPATKWTEAILHSFGSTDSDGVGPSAALVFNSAGALFGTTRQGGTSGNGTVFKLKPPVPPATTWTEKVLYSFGAIANDGANPEARLIFSQEGALFGTTAHGGTSGDNGTVFKLKPPETGLTQWTEKVLYSFKGGSDGALPSGGVIFDITGALYGLTGGGGTAGAGTLYKLKPPATGEKQWTETVKFAFDGADGSFPVGDLVLTAQTPVEDVKDTSMLDSKCEEEYAAAVNTALSGTHSELGILLAWALLVSVSCP